MAKQRMPLVTGTSSGMGKEIARLLLAHGDRVFDRMLRSRM